MPTETAPASTTARSEASISRSAHATSISGINVSADNVSTRMPSPASSASSAVSVMPVASAIRSRAACSSFDSRSRSLAALPSKNALGLNRSFYILEPIMVKAAFAGDPYGVIR